MKYILIMAVFLLGCDQNDVKDKQIAQLNRTIDSLRMVEAKRKKDSIDNSPEVKILRDKYEYRPTVYAFCIFKYKYIKTIPGRTLRYTGIPDLYIAPKDTLIYSSAIFDIKQISNNADDKYRFLDQSEETWRDMYMNTTGDSKYDYILLSRKIYSYNTYAEASQERQLHVLVQ